MTKQPDAVDAWLDEVRRWYFGGTPPAGDLPDEPAQEADVRERRHPESAPSSTRAKTGKAAGPSATRRS